MKLVLHIIVGFIFLLLPAQVFASTYGSGIYGGGLYGGMTPPPGTSPAEAGCTQSKPGNAPWLYGAVAQSKTSVLLYFTDSADPIDHYVLEYGKKSGEYLFGASNIGKKGTRTYLVQSLTPNTTYYFRVRGGNGCATGAWSNEMSVKTTVNGGIAWLSAKNTISTPELIPREGPAPSPLASQVPMNASLTTPIIQPTPLPEPTISSKGSPISPFWIAVMITAGIALLGIGTFFYMKRT